VAGWILIGLVVLGWELVTELRHQPTLTATVRNLGTFGRVVVFLLGLALLVHLVLPETWARHDPIDRLEHRLHRWIDERRR
jgi:hypothetical protein